MRVNGMLKETVSSDIVIIERRPTHALLVPFPIVCFTGTLLTDLAYWRTAEMMWADFSAWLLTFGLVFGVLAALAGLLDFFTDRLVRHRSRGWLHMIGNIVVLGLSVLNAFIHSRDAWTSVVPTGLSLSAAVVLLMIVTALTDRSLTTTAVSGGNP